MRAFIIGNGISLTPQDLDLLIGETCFATGRIWMIFDKTGWRPDYYVRTETEGVNVDDLVVDLRKMLSTEAVCYLSAGWRGHYDRYNLNVPTPGRCEWTRVTCLHTFAHARDMQPEGWHLPELCGFGSSLHVAMQIAVLKGYDPLYLLGCDLGYGSGQDHFDEDYGEGVRPADITNEDLLAAHEVARRSSPAAIYNCTRGGELEVYPRLALEEVLNGKE